MFLRILALAGLAAAPALAGDLSTVAAGPAPHAAVRSVPVPALRGIWSGGYGGVQLSYLNVSATDEAFGDDRSTGGHYGIHSGYRYDFGRFVLGGEVSYGRTDVTVPNGEDVDNLLHAGVTAGYDLGRLLPYVTGGYAAVSLKNNAVDFEEEYDGSFYGVGLAYQVTDHIILGGEVAWHRFDADGPDADIAAFGGRIAYRF